MRYIVLLVLFSQFSFGQVEELRKAQDKRKEYLNPETKTNYYSKTTFVNPFIGTGGHGHTYPGATAPFGMIQLSPDTRYEGWDGCSGYHYSDSVIYGFSHTHLSGTGVPDYCDLLIMPQSGEKKTNPGYLDENGFGSAFTHTNEDATAGYYAVHLDRGDIDVKLSVSQRCGIHEYTFNKVDEKRYVIIDLDHRDKLLDSEIDLIDKQSIQGFRVSSSWASEQHFYFSIKFDQPYIKAKIIDKNGKHKLLLTFPASTEKLLVKVGVSAVDMEGAAKNLESEIPDWNFNRVRADVTRMWNSELDKIEFNCDDKEIMTNFYSALYHSYLAPNLFNDVDGRYRGRDNQIHKLRNNEGNNYTVFSLWDTYRATHPLFTLTQVERTNDFIRTFLRQYDQGGDLPVWELAANETECMIGYHSVSVIADAYTKGIRGYDADKALQAMIATSRFNEFGKTHFRTKGFISAGEEPESVSKTLEYAYDDFCIAQMAKEVESTRTELQSTYYSSAMNFINLFDPQTGFMRARHSGLWYSPFDPAEVNFNYTEANSWQYSLYAPQAIDILSRLLGGGDSLELWLDQLFTVRSDLAGRHQVDITGLIGQYAHGNEPSHHMAYLYNYTSSPYKTQQTIDRIQREMYRNAPDGLSGNEDCGQMSSWYVLSALGLYQLAPGHPFYDFGRPLMDEATIHFENGKELVIRAVGNTAENKYIQSVQWNGESWESNQISHALLLEGGELLFEMGPTPPAKNRMLNHSAMRIEDYADHNFCPSPFFIAESRIFDDSMTVRIDHHKSLLDEDVIIHYRLSSDTTQLFVYHEPFTIYENTRIEAKRTNIFYLETNNNPQEIRTNESPFVVADFIKRDTGIELKLFSEYDHQYAAAGTNALIDGVRGGNEYRTGDWQGYWAQDISGEIIFSTPRSLREAGIGVLSDMKSWIFYPSEVMLEVYYSDGSRETFNKKMGQMTEDKMYPDHMDIVFGLNKAKGVSKLKITAKNYGKCPEWHPGSGNDTWLFADEIIIRE